MINYAQSLNDLFNQQLETGFVLMNPAEHIPDNRNIFFDMETCVPFAVQWNPDRDIRGNHTELIKRGIIAKDADPSQLVNIDANGLPCYLCRENIRLQNPKEILLDLELGGQKYLAGANFAPITNNHFTIMTADHRPQPSDGEIIPALIDATELTNGEYRALFNGLAGASIVGHEHFHITTSHFPVEDIRINFTDITDEGGGVRVSRPEYYLPLRIIEGINRAGTERAARTEITKWHSIDEMNHTVNIIAAKEGPIYRLHIFLRDKRKLRSTGRPGALAAFECGGIITVPGKDKNLFEQVNLKSIKTMLRDISP